METSTTSTQTPTPTPLATEDKTVAILAYVTLLGFIAAIVIHSGEGKKTALGAYHLRQSLGLMIAGFALGLCNIVPILGTLVALVGGLALIVLWVMGLIGAINGQMKPLPLIGPLVEKHLGTAFN